MTIQTTITVFLADDHMVVRDGLRALLESESDISVVGDTSNGREAVALVANQQVDVAIFDVAMPELNGIEATKKVRQLCPDTQVIILSMYASNEHIFRALRAGALGYVLKESAGAEVVQAIRKVFDGQRHLSQKISDELIDNYLQTRNNVIEKDPLQMLSTREREILQMVVDGYPNADIAERLSLSPKTVETYRSRMMKKLQMSDVTSLVKFAIQNGLTSV